MPQARVAPERTLDGVLGLELIESGEDHASGRIEVTDRVRQPMGLVHGGVYAAVAESLTSATTFLAVWPDGLVAVGLSNHTSFFRPVTDGFVHAEAKRRHRGRSTWVWEVEFRNDDGRLCALSRVTLAVRPAPSSTPSEDAGRE